MKAMNRRLRRLEDQLGGANGKPRKIWRMMPCPLGRKAELGKSTCRRFLCADGTVSETIVLAPGENGHKITDAELEEWIAGFPIELYNGPVRPTRLPHLNSGRSAPERANAEAKLAPDI